MSVYQQQADNLYNHLIDMEAGAEPEQLFLCSYLLGHISLASAEDGETAEQLKQQVEYSLDQAFKVDKLSEQDISDIRSLWKNLTETHS